MMFIQREQAKSIHNLKQYWTITYNTNDWYEKWTCLKIIFYNLFIFLSHVYII